MKPNTNAATDKKQKKLTTKKMVMIGIMGAVSTILMLFEFPLPFLVPPFIKMDFSELPIILCGFMYGPLAGFFTAFIKIVLNTLLGGTNTMGVGELANFITSVAYMLPAVLIYQKMRNKKGAIIGLMSGTLITSVFAIFNNMYLMFPFYAKVYGMPIDAIVDMGSAVNPLVDDMFTLMLFSMLPFNLMKFTLVSVIIFFVYKKISAFIRKFSE